MPNSNSIIVSDGIPNNRHGSNGDITIRYIKGSGVYLFIKAKNKWYSREFLSGKGKFSNVKEAHLNNPTSSGILSIYDARSGKYLPVKTDKAFTITFNGKQGVLTIGSSDADAGIDTTSGTLILGNDTTEQGILLLGKGATGRSTIATGLIDGLVSPGFLQIFAGFHSAVGYETILTVGSPILPSMNLKHVSIQSPYGPVLQLRECENLSSETELITNSQDRDFASTSHWSQYSPDGDAPAFGDDGSPAYLEITGTSDVNKQGAKLGTSYFTTLVAGNTYQVSAKIWTAGGTIANFKIELGGVATSDFTIGTSTTAYTREILVTSDAGLRIYYENDSTTQWFIDDVSIKKVCPTVGEMGSLYVERQSTVGDGVLKFRNNNGDISTLLLYDALTGAITLDEGILRLKEAGTAPSGTDTNYGRLYCKAADNKPYWMYEGGTEVDLTLGSTIASYLPLTGGAMTGAITTNSTFDGRDVAADGVLATNALPKTGGAMTGAITTNSTFDGVDIATRDGILTSTTTTANAALPKAGGTLTGETIIDRDVGGLTGSFEGFEIDYDSTGNVLGGATLNNRASDIDLTHSGNNAGTLNNFGLDLGITQTGSPSGTSNNTGIDLNVTSSGATNSGTINDVGLDIDVVSGTDGTSTAIGVHIDVDGADTNTGLQINTAGTHMKLVANADTSDYATLTLADTGDLTIATEGSGTRDSDITLDADGSIILDAFSGGFIAKNAGTEFSVANSSYAGMILGYTTDGIDSADDSHSVLDSWTVTDSRHKVTFKAPPSGVVEIFVSIYGDTSPGRPLYLGLSDSDTYAAIDFPNSADVTNQHLVWMGDETDEVQINHTWVVTGLTPNTEYTWWLGAYSSYTSAVVLRWGGDADLEYQPFIMKATALPEAVTDYAVYD